MGALTGKPVEGSRKSEERDAQCCICLTPLHVGTDWANAEKGPHHAAIWHCRVLHPDSVEDDAELAV